MIENVTNHKQISNINELPYFTVLGSKDICTSNRDIVGGFNKIRKKVLKSLIENKITKGHIFIIAPFMFENVYMTETEPKLGSFYTCKVHNNLDFIQPMKRVVKYLAEHYNTDEELKKKMCL